MKRFIKRTLLTIAVLLGSSLFMAAALLIVRKAVETPISDITLCLRSISFGVLLAYGYRMSIHIWKRAAWLDKLNKRIHNTLLSTGILTLLIFAGGAIISNLCTQVMNAIYEEVISMHMRLYLMALCGIGSLTLAIIAREIPTNGQMGTVLFRHFDTDEFRRACYACNVDPDSLTQSDLNKLQKTESADIGNGIWEKL